MEEAGRDDGTSRAILALFRAEGRIAKALERALVPAGLTGPKFNVLMELAASPEGGLPLHEVVRGLVKSAPNVTALIDRLESDGLVTRSRESRDRRVVTACITEKGWEALARAAPPLFEAEEQVVRSLSKADLEQLLRLSEAVAEIPED
jgi:MarR family transcriptional regulator, organic hydroperoxide resistance regulator